MTNYKEQRLRVSDRHGRFHVQIEEVGGGEWLTVAIREHREVAFAVLRAFSEALHAHTDDAHASALHALKRAKETQASGWLEGT